MYSAPEVISFDRRGRSADIYSLGCVFTEINTVAGGRRIEDFHDFRSEPVPDEPDRMTLVYHATSYKLEAWFAMQDDPWPFYVTSRMMTDDPKTRPTADELLDILPRPSTSRTCNCI
jgi:serine/threonine protein kinase